VRLGRKSAWCLTARPTAAGEKHHASINHLSRPRLGANVGRHNKPH
jgi:hypothetical protein